VLTTHPLFLLAKNALRIFCRPGLIAVSGTPAKSAVFAGEKRAG
jgi:hypothetical protein